MSLNNLQTYAGELSRALIKSAVFDSRGNKFSSTTDLEKSAIFEKKLDDWAANEIKDLLAEASNSFKAGQTNIVINQTENTAKCGGFNSNNNCLSTNESEYGTRNLNHNNSCSPSTCYAKEDKSYHGYATELVNDLFCDLRRKEGTQSSSSKDSTACDSCESISSDLMSPQSNIDSRGLHTFADKLLYSLSHLENKSNEEINDISECQELLQKIQRRASAPELRSYCSRTCVNLRKVFGHECSGKHHSNLCDKHRLQSHGILSTMKRRLSSIEIRQSMLLESNEEDFFGERAFSAILVNDILSSAYRDVE